MGKEFDKAMLEKLRTVEQKLGLPLSDTVDGALWEKLEAAQKQAQSETKKPPANDVYYIDVNNLPILKKMIEAHDKGVPEEDFFAEMTGVSLDELGELLNELQEDLKSLASGEDRA